MLVRFVSQGVPLAEGDMNEIPEVETPAASGIYDDEGNMLQSFMDRVREALARDDAVELRDAIGGLHETELGEVLGLSLIHI